ncbi:MAG: TrkH family potassium uptake protein, partial [Bdellovibrionales bacterium]|nr:TrkH family potassium uptake protein [Bdellovibrionales bacterium]
YRSLWMQGFKAVREAVQAKGLLIIQLVMIALFLLIMAIGDGVTSLSQIGQTTVMAVSAQTTTGFSLLDPVELSSGTLLVFILAMLIGGCIGSTAGGIKVFRLQVLLKLYQLTILRINQSSSAVTQDKLGHHHLSNALIQGTLCSVFLFLTTIIVSWLPFLLLDYDPLLSLFDIVSAVGTVGLSTGLTSTELPTFLKGVLMVDMTLGRLEIIPILVLFSKNAWFSKRRDNR